MHLSTEKRKLSFALSLAMICFSSGALAADFVRVLDMGRDSVSQINEDLSRFAGYPLVSQRIFRANPWDLAFDRPTSIINFIAGNMPYVFENPGGVTICHNDKSADESADLVVNGARVPSCAAPEMALTPTPGLDLTGEPGGMISVVRGKGFLEGNGSGGGYALNPYQVIPFQDSDAGIFWVHGGDIPPSLSSLQAQTLYRVAQYAGDSLIQARGDFSFCEGIAGSDGYVCDPSVDGVFALKGAALLSFASSCEECSGLERATLVGEGLNYLFSIPYSADLSTLAAGIYAQNKDVLVEAGYDVAVLERKKLLRLIK